MTPITAKKMMYGIGDCGSIIINMTDGCLHYVYTKWSFGYNPLILSFH